MIRVAAFIVAVLLLAALFGARSADPSVADPVRLARLTRVAFDQAAAADAALAAAETLMRDATVQARHGQAAILTGTDDPAAAMNVAAEGFEAAAAPVAEARAALDILGWTLRAADTAADPPSLTVGEADLVAVGEQWRASVPPGSALADQRRDAEAVLESLGDALAALEADDLDGARQALDLAEESLAQLSEADADLSTLGYWVDTVEALIEATRDITESTQSGDAAALAAAEAAFDAAAADASRADQALTIALGEAASRITGPASASSAAALRAVVSARDQLARLSILR